MDENIHKFQRRKRNAEITIVTGFVALLAALIVFIVLDASYVTGGLGVGGLILFFFGFSSYSEVHENFKKDFLQDLMEEWVDGGVYEPRHGLTEYQVYNSQFFKYADELYAQDLLSGSINGIPFVSSDIILREKVDGYATDTPRVHYKPFFKGRMFTFEFNKPFEGELLVLENAEPAEKKHFKRFDTDDPAFNETFNIYANSKAMVEDMITNEFIQRMYELEKNHEGQINVSFTESKLHIAINTWKDTFRLKLFNPLNEELLETFKKDVNVIFHLIETLKLNDAPFED